MFFCIISDVSGESFLSWIGEENISFLFQEDHYSSMNNAFTLVCPMYLKALKINTPLFTHYLCPLEHFIWAKYIFCFTFWRNCDLSKAVEDALKKGNGDLMINAEVSIERMFIVIGFINTLKIKGDVINTMGEEKK